MKQLVLLFIFMLFLFDVSTEAQNYTCYQERINRAKTAYNNCEYTRALKWIKSITTNECLVPENNEIKSLTAKVNAGLSDNCDNDGDGVLNRSDRCPNAAGPKNNNGCPVADADYDGFADNVDACPDKYSTTNRGCPEGPKQLSFIDRFDDNRNEWPFNSRIKVNSSKLSFKDTARFHEIVRDFNMDCSKNFSYSVQTSWRSDGDGYCGLVFSTGDTSYYYFIISTAGEYAVKCSTPSIPFKHMIGWTHTNDIKKGHVPNTLGIEKREDFAVFYINGQAQDTIPFSDERGSRFGLCISGRGEKLVEFDDFNLHGITKPASNYAPASNKYSFVDYFFNNENSWPLSTDTQRKISIERDKMVIEGYKSGYAYYSTKSHGIDVSKNFTLYAEISLIKSNGDGMGLVFCESDNRIYTFMISEHSTFAIYKHENGNWVPLVKWTSFNAAYKKAKSKLLIKKRGSDLFFYVNGQLVTSLPSMNDGDSIFGVRVERDQKVEFDNFMITGEKKTYRK